VTVNVVTGRLAVAVPLMAPVLVLNDTPVGSDPPVIAKVSGAVPPLAVTGTNAKYAMPTVSVVLGTACVVASAVLTVRSKVLDETADAASVTVTVNVVAASVAVGVPEIVPVAAAKLIPLGSVPPLSTNAYGRDPPAAVTGVKAE
jgi:hypothetical protein